MTSKQTAVGSSSSSKISASEGFVCHHKRQAVLKTAGTPNNFGRLFYRCPYWNDKKLDCGFFKWAEYRDRVTEAGTGDEVMSRNVELDAKLNDLKSSLTEATDMVRSLKSMMEQGRGQHDARLGRELSRVAEKVEVLGSRISHVLIVLVCFVAVFMIVVFQNNSI
ncbi:hypothetical protein LINPERPRIM_LOCUS5754 [Linum perenne]